MDLERERERKKAPAAASIFGEEEIYGRGWAYNARANQALRRWPNEESAELAK